MGKMKTSIAALSCLILAAQATAEYLTTNLKNEHSVFHGAAFHRPTDCCTSYTRLKIRCVFMKGYVETASECSRPAVILITKTEQHVCANPKDKNVQKCVSDMKLRSVIKDLRTLSAEKRYLE
ncbi:C-C motif chemokine 15-like isoform X1 [Neophocaena asiaeorientalis asiaeorientalis]|uniref:C-C motif chemokine n=1 Tax=Neophocaena asiaeorientalis asiaeorientalis TaxID=1706337 RepID=A0A341CFY9_NEOAA|nr:C-C motif chemokine 15-like isoform X1 [Neophocaena asiaeorientalis asiaeorientalis]